jgi:hypothetical protein
MDHDLVAFSRRAGFHAVVQRRLRDQRQRVRLLLAHARRLLGNIHGRRSRGNVGRLSAPALIECLAGGRQGLHEHRADLRFQPPANHHHTVVVLIHAQRTVRVALGGLERLGLAVHGPPGAHDPLDVLRGARPTDGEQPLFRVRRRHARERPDLRVRQLPAREGLGQARQGAEGACDADVLARGTRGEPHAPRQPFGARTEAVAPAAARVELADQVKKPCGGGIEMRGEHRDLVAQPIQRLISIVGGNEARGKVHRRVPLLLGRLYTHVFVPS